MAETARRAFVATVVAVGVVAFALALWKVRVVVGLLFLAFTISAAMRPGVEALHRHRLPRVFGVLVQYVVLAAIVAFFLWLVVPRAIAQVDQAIKNVPTTRAQIGQAAHQSTGIKHDVLVGIQHRLKRLPRASEFVKPALDLTVRAFEAIVAVFFVLAAAAYWIFERDRAIGLVASLLPREKRKRMRDTWDLIDAKLGAFVRGQALLIVLVGTVLSTAFAIIGLPYWILVGSFAGLVEIVPVIGPLAAGALAIGVGLTVSWHTALAAGLAVLAVRLLEDYIVLPKVLGDATGLSPLVVLFSVSAIGLLLGGFYVLLAIPIAAVLATLIDVVVRDVDPAEQEVPAVLFAGAKEEGG